MWRRCLAAELEMREASSKPCVYRPQLNCCYPNSCNRDESTKKLRGTRSAGLQSAVSQKLCSAGRRQLQARRLGNGERNLPQARTRTPSERQRVHAGSREDVPQTNQRRRRGILVVHATGFSKAPSGARQERHIPDVADGACDCFVGGRSTRMSRRWRWERAGSVSPLRAGAPQTNGGAHGVTRPTNHQAQGKSLNRSPANV